MNLATTAAMWPTPQIDSFRSRGGERKDEKGLDRMARDWPTPMATDGNKPSAGNRKSADLTSASQMWMTPTARDHKDGSRNIAVMREEGGDTALVTDGDTIDDAPAWVPVGPEVTEGRHQLVYQSTGIGRDAAGMMAGFAPTEINLLDAERGDLKTILESPDFDYLGPRMERDGALLVMRRPHHKGPQSPDAAATLKDGALMPFRLLYAGFRYLDFFSMRYTGKPLSTAGNTKARRIDARKLIERQNIGSDDGEQEDEELGRAPSDWVLLRRRPDGQEQVLSERVVSYDVTPSGEIFVSDGRVVERITADGARSRVAKTPRVMALAAAR